MMDDKELLEFAAKAQGYFYASDALWDGRDVVSDCWNPLTDDGDALRLAVSLKMHVDIDEYSCTVFLHPSSVAKIDIMISSCEEDSSSSAVRRAIVLAAAELGKTI